MVWGFCYWRLEWFLALKPAGYDCEHGIAQVSTDRRINSFMHYYTEDPRYSNSKDAEKYVRFNRKYHTNAFFFCFCFLFFITMALCLLHHHQAMQYIYIYSFSWSCMQSSAVKSEWRSFWYCRLVQTWTSFPHQQKPHDCHWVRRRYTGCNSLMDGDVIVCILLYRCTYMYVCRQICICV